MSLLKIALALLLVAASFHDGSIVVGAKMGGGGGKKGFRKHKKKDECMVIPFYSNNAIFQANLKTNPSGSTVANIPIFSREDDSVIGDFTIDATDMQNDGNGVESFNHGMVRFYAKGTTEVEGTLFFMGYTPNSPFNFAITSGLGKYQCAQGLLKFAGFEANQFRLDATICGKLCNYA